MLVVPDYDVGGSAAEQAPGHASRGTRATCGHDEHPSNVQAGGLAHHAQDLLAQAPGDDDTSHPGRSIVHSTRPDASAFEPTSHIVLDCLLEATEELKCSLRTHGLA